MKLINYDGDQYGIPPDFVIKNVFVICHDACRHCYFKLLKLLRWSHYLMQYIKVKII